MTLQHGPGGPFGEHDYEIVYGRMPGPFSRAGDVSIRAVRAQPLVVGDLYTFGRDNRLWDVIVAEVSLGAGSGWNARCRMVDGSPR